MSDNATVTATPMRERVAEEIRVLLARRRMSASELARQAGMTQPYISRRLTGEIAFDVDDLDKIAVALGVKPADLLGPIADKPVPTVECVPRQVKAQARTHAPTRPPTRSGDRHQTTRSPNYPTGARRPQILASGV